MSTNTAYLSTLGNEYEIMRLQKLDASCNAEGLGNKGQSARGTVALADPLQQILDLLLRVNNGVFANIELQRLRPVDLQHSEMLFMLIAPY